MKYINIILASAVLGAAADFAYNKWGASITGRFA